MKKVQTKIRNYLIFIFFRVRPFTRQKAQEIANRVSPGQKILEIGSGKKEKDGTYYFSNKKYFKDKQVEFFASDINPEYGHRVIDISNFSEKEEYNHILCFHVLDDIYNWQKALLNLMSALKTGGSLHLVLPGFCGLDYDVDLFRFTRKLMERFCRENNLKIKRFETKGPDWFPFAYYLEIKK